MKTKFLSILTLLTFFCQTGKAQQSDFLDRVKLEAGWGYNLPTAPTDGITASDFAGVRSFYVGAQYKLNDIWGVRGTYAYNGFQHRDESEYGLKIHKLMAEATFSILRAAESDLASTFDVGAHAGLGLSFGSSESQSGTDMMANFQIGLMPVYQITEKFSVHLDAAYVVNFKQDYGFHGLQAKAANKGTTGGYFVANIGVGFALN